MAGRPTPAADPDLPVPTNLAELDALLATVVTPEQASTVLRLMGAMDRQPDQPKDTPVIHTLVQAAGLWALLILAAATLFGAALTGRRRQARHDRAYQLRRMHVTGQITDEGIDRLRQAIRAHGDNPT